MRVSDNMKYYSTIKNMNNLQEGYNTLLEKLASQKKINRPSDDPTGMMKILDCRQTLATIEQYQSNIEQGTTWISMTETTLSGINDLFSIIKTAADNFGSETTSGKAILAGHVRDVRDQILALANSQLGGNYLFSGSLVSTKPFSATPHPASTEIGMGARNTYGGTITAGGTFMGTSNKTYVVRMTANGTVGSASYQLSTDGGKTWGAVSSAWSGAGTDTILLDNNGTPLDTSDDLNLTFDAGSVAQNDVFYVKAYTAGYYKGDGEALSLPVGADNAADYSSPGEGLFVRKNGAGYDLFETLSALITAMEADDEATVEGLIADLEGVREQLQFGASLISTKQSRLNMAKNSLNRLTQKVTDIAANAENADVTELGMLLSMKDIALKSTYSLATKLGENSILNFLR